MFLTRQVNNLNLSLIWKEHGNQVKLFAKEDMALDLECKPLVVEKLLTTEEQKVERH